MRNENFKILLIDKDEELLSVFSAAIKAEGYSVFTCTGSRQSINLAKDELPHLIVSEILLSESDGIEICIEVRKLPELKDSIFVFLTDRKEEYSQLTAFEAGADDYIIKPVKTRVFLSRLKALLKRHPLFAEENKPESSKGLVIDRERYLVYKEGKTIVLPRKEFELLAMLCSSPQKVFTRKEISQLIWGYEIFSKNRTIDVHIRKLREKIGDEYIKTVKGIGYSLRK